MLKLKAVPAYLVEVPNSVIIKRGCTVFKVTGEGASAAIQSIFEAVTEKEATRAQIYELFPPEATSTIARLLDQLMERRFIIEQSNEAEEGTSIKEANEETNLDVFYWECGEGSVQTLRYLKQRKLLIVGVNSISRRLAMAFNESGMANYEVVDHPLLRNLRFFSRASELIETEWRSDLPVPKECINPEELEADCFIVTSDFGISPEFNEWNKLCLAKKSHLLPLVLENVVGYVGPMIVPGETACFECLHARQNSHLMNLATRATIEVNAFAAQQVVGFHPSMPAVIGEVAAFELTKFYSGTLPGWNVGKLIEINMLKPSIVSRAVLKVPRCLACSPLNGRASTTPDKSVFVPLDE